MQNAIADKLLVSAALIALVEQHLAPAWAVVIILGREFAVTGLRSVAASEGLIIHAQKIGKIKMWAQCVAIVALMVAGANGNPPVSNFGWSLPTFLFWEVEEVRTAFSHLANFSLTSADWQVFGYLVGRGGLWIADDDLDSPLARFGEEGRLRCRQEHGAGRRVGARLDQDELPLRVHEKQPRMKPPPAPRHARDDRFILRRQCLDDGNLGIGDQGARRRDGYTSSNGKTH